MNGFEFKSNSVDELKEAMKKIINTSDDDLMKMGKRSQELAQRVNQSLWAKTVIEF